MKNDSKNVACIKNNFKRIRAERLAAQYIDFILADLLLNINMKNQSTFLKNHTSV